MKLKDINSNIIVNIISFVTSLIAVSAIVFFWVILIWTIG